MNGVVTIINLKYLIGTGAALTQDRNKISTTFSGLRSTYVDDLFNDYDKKGQGLISEKTNHFVSSYDFTFKTT